MHISERGSTTFVEAAISIDTLPNMNAYDTESATETRLILANIIRVLDSPACNLDFKTVPYNNVLAIIFNRDTPAGLQLKKLYQKRYEDRKNKNFRSLFKDCPGMAARARYRAINAVYKACDIDNLLQRER